MAMSKIEILLQEVGTLKEEEMEMLMREIQQRLERVRRIRAVLNEVRGAGTGVWPMDAQEFVNQSREDRNFRD